MDLISSVVFGSKAERVLLIQQSHNKQQSFAQTIDFTPRRFLL